MGFTQVELDALKEAYAAGALRVTHEGKTVEYGSESDLLRRIRVVEQSISGTGSVTKGRRTVLRFSRG